MRLNLFYHRNKLSITQWLERSVLSFSFCSVSLNQTASYCSPTRSGWMYRKVPGVFRKSEIFGNHLLVNGEIDETAVVSPLSFQVVLSLLAAGSGGSTRRQLLTFLDTDSVDRLNAFASQICDVILADGDPAVGPRIRCSNGLWLDESLTLKPSFKQILDSDYRAALNPVDFQSKARHVRQQINSWVENETSGLVKDLIHEESLNNSVKLVFTNALYLKGPWDVEAKPPFVSEEYYDNENFVTVPFMTAKRKEFCRWDKGYSIQNKPLKKQSEEEKRSVNMIFYCPVTKDTNATLMDVGGSMIPKYSISSEVEASDVLRQLGVTLLFSGGQLTKMLSGEKLYVLNIFQKAFMAINEQGTEAATATAVIIVSGCPPDLPHVPTIKSNGCFPCLLSAGKDEYGNILMARSELVFMQVVNPHLR